MKIVIFEPHPDDLLFGPGPILLEWIKEGEHDIHVVTVTDGRACYRSGDDVFTADVASMTEDDVAEMRISEAKKSIEYLGLPLENLHLFYFHDADGHKYVKEGIEKAIPLIKDANRIVLPSTHTDHVDHQATYDIAVGAAKELNLTDIEYFVYFEISRGRFQQDSKDNQFQYAINEANAFILQEWLKIYQSQAKTKWTWKMYTTYIQKARTWTYATYNFEDIGKYYNF
ncbi:MAG: PIG-L family deacetylase [Candidatus Lokiarchaeota archaeon]|nr:PIG-L family deacetylase [Candidatus Lokiarchaeota archaeon]